MQKNTHVRNNKVTAMSNEKENVDLTFKKKKENADFLVRMVIMRANRRTYGFANQFWLANQWRVS